MNITRPDRFAGMPVLAELQSLMEQIFHKVPSVSFEAHDYEMYPSEVANEDYAKKIVRVTVFNGNEEVGKLSAKRESYRNSGKQMVYRVKSPHINNRISPKDVKTTTDVKQALKAAIKHFGRTATASETIEDAKIHVNNEFSSVVYNANRNVERIGDDHEMELIELAFAVSKGEQFDMQRIRKVLSYKDAEKLLSTNRITRSVMADFKGNTGIIVKEERDGTLTAISLDASMPTDSRVTRHADSYGLPELYQPKLAMLRMLEYKQPVESIGIKYSINKANWYYLTGGEIITHS